jgi:hypothetical protein
MNEAVNKFRQEWEKLELDLLVPAHLSNEQCAALLRGRENRNDKAFFTEMSGATIARFREAAKNEILTWATTQEEMQHDTMDRGGNVYVNKVRVWTQ